MRSSHHRVQREQRRAVEKSAMEGHGDRRAERTGECCPRVVQSLNRMPVEREQSIPAAQARGVSRRSGKHGTHLDRTVTFDKPCAAAIKGYCAHRARAWRGKHELCAGYVDRHLKSLEQPCPENAVR